MPRDASNPPPRRAGLTRARVLEGALVLVDREGAERLTMRRLGDALGVEAMSLYHHVPNRDGLVEGIGELLMARLPAAAPTATWNEACRTFAGGLRAITLAHPEAFRLIGLRPLAAPAALAPVEALLGRLVAAGARPAEALAAYRALASFARGYALAEVAGFTVDASTADGRGLLQALDPAAFPVLGGTVDQLAGLTPDGAWEDGLTALLDGLRTRSVGLTS